MIRNLKKLFVNLATGCPCNMLAVTAKTARQRGRTWASIFCAVNNQYILKYRETSKQQIHLLYWGRDSLWVISPSLSPPPPPPSPLESLLAGEGRGYYIAYQAFRWTNKFQFIQQVQTVSGHNLSGPTTSPSEKDSDRFISRLLHI